MDLSLKLPRDAGSLEYRNDGGSGALGPNVILINLAGSKAYPHQIEFDLRVRNR